MEAIHDNEPTETIIAEQGGDSVFINKLLGEMKSHFNSGTTEITVDSEAASDLSETKEQPYVNDVKEIEEDNEEYNGVTFKKPNAEFPNETNISPSRRSLRNRSTTETRSPESMLKRSSRRRSKDCGESVLQNAIARKEKSYNEASKPQRLTRQLKPTQKILENLALAKQERYRGSKSPKRGLLSDDLDFSPTSGKRARGLRRSPKKSKRFKDSDRDTDSDESVSADSETLEFAKSTRRSRRLSSRNRDDLVENSSPIAADQPNNFPDDPDCLSEEAQLSTAQLCLCIKKSNLFSTPVEDEIVYCNAVDTIEEKTIGCSRIVNVEETPLLRPSQRVPYTLLCSLHQNRLLRHNCCPTCGKFCTQGFFLECEAKHHYHQNCQLKIGDTECCPHCGLATAGQDIYIKMHCLSKPVFLPTQKASYSSAKMGFSQSNSDLTCSTPLLLPMETFQTFTTSQLESKEFTSEDILEALKVDDVSRLASIIALNSIDLQFKIADFNDGTLMHYAAHKGRLSICNLLVSAGLEIDELDREQNTPLMLAISENRNDVVQYLIKAGADIAIKGTDGMSPLHYAAKHGNTPACRLLVEAGAIVDARDDGGWTPLTWACEHGKRETVAYLLAKGADPRARDVEYNEPLHWAAFSGTEEIIGMLLGVAGTKQAAMVDTRNAHGETPLHIAAREDKYNCAIVLLARGASVSVLNKNNESPLDCVPSGGNSYGPIALNVKLQAITESNRKNRTILSSDISRGRETNPIRCVNTLDDEQEPTDYTYITKSCLTSDNVRIDTKLTLLQSCNCTDRCTSEYCECCKLSTGCWYSEDGVLMKDFNFADPPMVFECNETCSCNAITCKNRVVQKGPQHRFELYKTEGKGWGVKTLRHIPKGGYVCEYIGEILTDVEANCRDEDSFLFDLDNRDVDSYCVDAKRYGNFARFINHSCSPNLHPVKVFVDHQDLRFPRIAFFALRDIPVDEELSFDYGHKFWLVKYKSFTCQCGSSDCKYSQETISQALLSYKKMLEEEDGS